MYEDRTSWMSKRRFADSEKKIRDILILDGLMFYSLHPEGSRLGFFDFRDRNFEQVDQFSEGMIKR